MSLFSSNSCAQGKLLAALECAWIIRFFKKNSHNDSAVGFVAVALKLFLAEIFYVCWRNDLSVCCHHNFKKF